jgi:hypothetical protein
MDPRSFCHLKKLLDSKVIIVRHANSTFNYKWSRVEEEIAAGLETNAKFYEVIKDT